MEEVEHGTMVEDDAAMPLDPASTAPLDPLDALDAAQPPSLMELADSSMNDAVST
jgi:hypothetical protein